MKITKDMSIIDILAADEHITDILMAKGMHCIHCFAAAGETLEEAMMVHGYDSAAVDELVDQINDFLEPGEAQEA